MSGRMYRERAVHRHHLHRVLAYTSALANHSPGNIRAHRGLAIRMRAAASLSLKRLPLPPAIATQSQPFTPSPNKSMADDKAAPAQQYESATQAKDDKDRGVAEGSEKSPPPPPDKPLQGDCCGSGCVRCVWDVYYDELDEYNKLYKNDSDPNSKPSS